MAATGERSFAHPGWKVVAACFCMAVFTWAFGFYGQGVFLARLHEQRGWPVAQISSATTAFYLLSAVLVAFVGDAIARIGPRALLTAGILCVAAATALLGQVAELWQLYAVNVIMAFGWAGTGVAAITATIGSWFDERRGLAISLALNGASVGGIVGVPLLVASVDRFGFASALFWGGLGMAALLVPLIGLLVRSPARQPGAATRPAAPASRREIMRSLAFWTITLPFAAAFFVQVGFVVHQFSLVEQASDPATASLAVGLTAVMAVAGRLALGLVVDRIDQRLASALSLLSQAAALALCAAGGSGTALVIASALFGLSVGNVITLPALIVHREFPPASFAAVVALSTAIGQFVYAFGPGAIGWLRDASGSYRLPLLLCLAIEAAAAAFVLVRGRRPQSPPDSARNADLR